MKIAQEVAKNAGKCSTLASAIAKKFGGVEQFILDLKKYFFEGLEEDINTALSCEVKVKKSSHPPLLHLPHLTHPFVLFILSISTRSLRTLKRNGKRLPKL